MSSRSAWTETVLSGLEHGLGFRTRVPSTPPLSSNSLEARFLKLMTRPPKGDVKSFT